MTIPQPMTLNYQMYILRHPPPAGYFWLVCGSDQHGYHSWQSAYSRPENARCLEWGRRRPRARWEDPRPPAVRWPHGASYNTRHVSAPSRGRAILSSIDQALKRPLLRKISGFFLKHATFSKICTRLELCSQDVFFLSLKTSELSPFDEKSPEVKALMGYLQWGLGKEKCWKAILIHTKL